ncbi:unnamed protein product [Penicillium camemberti]|uniref:Str. FM013 n=1 Tax=Penicillium camemberti (strain FM 013) TaxID=1429867 RepID=A0A0G4PK64_PENC3|nr:unnamed protein product [Penicillium camemberti]
MAAHPLLDLNAAELKQAASLFARSIVARNWSSKPLPLRSRPSNLFSNTSRRKKMAPVCH